MVTMTSPERRNGAETRAEILRVALRLFTEKGYEGTSTRDITDALGLTKSSLYYHFRNKEEIVASLMTERRRDMDEFVEWIKAQPRTPDLTRRAAEHWLATAKPEHLQTMRLAQANQPLIRRLGAGGWTVRSAFDQVIDLLLADGAGMADRLLLRMAFDTVSAALLSSQGTDATPADVIEAARRASRALSQ
jgi:AcrR family transcriptional regulator